MQWLGTETHTLPQCSGSVSFVTPRPDRYWFRSRMHRDVDRLLGYFKQQPVPPQKGARGIAWRIAHGDWYSDRDCDAEGGCGYVSQQIVPRIV